MAFDAFLFEAFSQLSGGLITDMKTLLLGMLMLGMILIGFDMLREKIGGALLNYSAGKSFSSAQGFLGMRNSSGAGSAEYEYYDALYKAHLNRSVSISMKTGKTFSVDESVDHGGAGFNPLYQDEGGGSSDGHPEIEAPEDYVYHGNDVFYGGRSDSGGHPEIEAPEDYFYHENDVFYGSRFDSGDADEVDFDGDIDSPGLYQKHIRNRYF